MGALELVHDCCQPGGPPYQDASTLHATRTSPLKCAVSLILETVGRPDANCVHLIAGGCLVSGLKAENERPQALMSVAQGQGSVI